MIKSFPYSIPRFAWLILATFLFVACTTNDYETGDGNLSYYRADFVDAYTNSKAYFVNAMTDDGDSLLFSAPLNVKWATTPDSAYRALLYYNKVEGKSQPRSAYTVYVPSIRPISKVKEMHNDPVKMISAWRSKNGRYVNLCLGLVTGTNEGDDSKHSVGMVCDTLLQHDNGSKHLQLRFFHSRNSMPEYYTTKVYFSIPLKNNPYHLGTGDSLSVAVNTYEGWVTKTFTY